MTICKLHNSIPGWWGKVWCLLVAASKRKLNGNCNCPFELTNLYTTEQEKAVGIGIYIP